MTNRILNLFFDFRLRFSLLFSIIAAVALTDFQDIFILDVYILLIGVLLLLIYIIYTIFLNIIVKTLNKKNRMASVPKIFEPEHPTLFGRLSEHVLALIVCLILFSKCIAYYKIIYFPGREITCMFLLSDFLKINSSLNFNSCAGEYCHIYFYAKDMFWTTALFAGLFGGLFSLYKK